MAKPNYYTRRAFTALAAGAVLTMLLLVAVRPALAQTAVEAPHIDYPANNSVDSDGDFEVGSYSEYDMQGNIFDLYEDLPEGPNKVGTGYVYGYCSIDCDCPAGCAYDSSWWSVWLTDVPDGTHTYYAVATDYYGNVSDRSDTVTVKVDSTIPPTVDYFMPSPDGVTTKGSIGGVSANIYYTSVLAAFSKNIDPNTLTPSTFTLVKNESDGSTTTPVAATVANYANYPDWFYLKLPSYLEGGTNYMATIKGGPDGVKDEFGNPLTDDKVWSFTTATWPTVDSVSPSDEAPEVPINTNVTATFSKDINSPSLSFTLLKEGSTTPVAATVRYDTASKKAMLDPSSNLRINTQYTATIKGGAEGVKDYQDAYWVQGNPLAADKVWSFTTSAPDDVTPPQTTIDSGPSGLTNDNTPTFSFSGTDDLSASENLLYSYKVDSSSEWSDYSDQTSVTLPSLSDGGHIFYAKAKDEVGNEDGSLAERSFTVDATPPKVSTVSPDDGAARDDWSQQVPVDTKFTISFAEALHPDSVTTADFRLWSQSDASGGGIWELVPTSVALSTDGKTATLTPMSMLSANTMHTLMIPTGTGGLTDMAGNALSCSVLPCSDGWLFWRFTTLDPDDVTPPKVSSVSPSDGTTGVGRGTNVTATFSEAIDSTTVKSSTFTLVKSGTTTPISATLSYDAASRTATLNPYGATATTLLSQCTWYKATVTSGVKDKAANALAANKVWSFKTRGC